MGQNLASPFFSFFVCSALIFTVIAITYQPPDPWLDSLPPEQHTSQPPPPPTSTTPAPPASTSIAKSSPSVRCLPLRAPNRFTFPSVLKACAEMAGTEEGQQIYGHIVKRGLEADTFVLSNLLRVYVTCGMMEKARQLFERSFELDEIGSEDAEVVMWNVMVDGHLRMGDILAAGHLFNEMPRKSVIAWNGMITGYAQNGFFKEALDIFREMQMSNVRPNYVTLVGVLPAISRLGALDLDKWVHA